MVSARNGRVEDFVGVELQTMDTTGSLWQTRQQFLLSASVIDSISEFETGQPYGMNWKMTAKTILIQLHHKIQTFEGIGKRLVLVLQDHFLNYLISNFSFEHVKCDARLQDSMQFHVYELMQHKQEYRINLVSRLSTDASGLATCLGMKAEPKLALIELQRILENKITDRTLLSIQT